MVRNKSKMAKNTQKRSKMALRPSKLLRISQKRFTPALPYLIFWYSFVSSNSWTFFIFGMGILGVFWATSFGSLGFPRLARPLNLASFELGSLKIVLSSYGIGMAVLWPTWIRWRTVLIVFSINGSSEKEIREDEKKLYLHRAHPYTKASDRRPHVWATALVQLIRPYSLCVVALALGIVRMGNPVRRRLKMKS